MDLQVLCQLVWLSLEINYLKAKMWLKWQLFRRPKRAINLVILGLRLRKLNKKIREFYELGVPVSEAQLRGRPVKWKY